MRSHTWSFLVPILVVLFLGAVPSLARAQEGEAAKPQPASSLDKPIDLSLTNADLDAAVKALNETRQVSARVDGKAPDKKITLAVKNTPARDVLDALAALYGVRWEHRVTMVVLSARRPAGKETAEAVPGLSETAQKAINALRELGLGTTPPRARDFAQELWQFAGLFTPQQQQQMAAVPDASQLGVRVRDLPQAAQQAVLAFQSARYSQAVDEALYVAARQFDPRAYLDSVLFLQFAPGQPAALAFKMPTGVDSYYLPQRGN